MGISIAKGFIKPFSLVSIFSWLVGYSIGHCSPILRILWFMIAKNLSSGLYLLLLYFLKLRQNQPLYLSLWCLYVSVCVLFNCSYLTMNRRKCKNVPNRFWYICGKVAMPDQHSEITQFVKSYYHAYFGIRIGDQDKSFAPHTCCRTCVENLRR